MVSLKPRASLKARADVRAVESEEDAVPRTRKSRLSPRKEARSPVREESPLRRQSSPKRRRSSPRRKPSSPNRERRRSSPKRRHASPSRRRSSPKAKRTDRREEPLGYGDGSRRDSASKVSPRARTRRRNASASLEAIQESSPKQKERSSRQKEHSSRHKEASSRQKRSSSRQKAVQSGAAPKARSSRKVVAVASDVDEPSPPRAASRHFSPEVDTQAPPEADTAASEEGSESSEQSAPDVEVQPSMDQERVSPREGDRQSSPNAEAPDTDIEEERNLLGSGEGESDIDGEPILATSGKPVSVRPDLTAMQVAALAIKAAAASAADARVDLDEAPLPPCDVIPLEYSIAERTRKCGERAAALGLECDFTTGLLMHVVDGDLIPYPRKSRRGRRSRDEEDDSDDSSARRAPPEPSPPSEDSEEIEEKAKAVEAKQAAFSFESFLAQRSRAVAAPVELAPVSEDLQRKMAEAEAKRVKKQKRKRKGRDFDYGDYDGESMDSADEQRYHEEVDGDSLHSSDDFSDLEPMTYHRLGDVPRSRPKSTYDGLALDELSDIVLS